MSKETDALKKAIDLGKQAVELLQKSHVKQHARVSASGAVSQVSAYDDKRQAAEEASGRANESQSKLNWNDATPMRHTASDHAIAAHAHVKALVAAHTNQDINHHLHAASRHLQASDSMQSFAASQSKSGSVNHALDASNHAKDLSEHANSAKDSEKTSEGLNKKSSLHMLAMEQHNRAESAHKKVASEHYNNEPKREAHMIQAQHHHDAATAHGKEVSRLSRISIAASNKAHDASDKAGQTGKPEDHKAAAEAHRAAAKLDYDSETGPAHEATAKAHDAKATADDHPQIIGKATSMDDKDPKETSTFQHNGKRYLSTGKQGKSFHDGRPVREFESPDGHRAWLDHHANVHADSTEEAKAYRKERRFSEHDDK